MIIELGCHVLKFIWVESGPHICEDSMYIATNHDGCEFMIIIEQSNLVIIFLILKVKIASTLEGIICNFFAIQTYKNYLGSLTVWSVSMFSETDVETCVVCVREYQFTPWVSVSVILKEEAHTLI